MIIRLLAASACAALLATAASAQTSNAAPAPAAAAPDVAPAPAAAAPAASDPAAQAPVTGYNAQPGAVPVTAPGTPDLVAAKAGDPNVVSNGPVADTPENRAKYGKPDSNAGNRTKPAGN